MKRLFFLSCAVLIASALATTVAAAAVTPSKSEANAPGANAPVVSSAKHFDADTATQEWMATLSPEARAKSDAYYEGGYWLLLWDCVVTLLTAWLLLGTRLSARVRDKLEAITRLKWLQTAFYAVFYLIFTTLVTLPWVIYESWFREHQYGMSNQDLAGFLGDEGKALIVNLILGTVAITVIYAVIRKAARSWWLWGALTGIVFVVFGAAIGPTYLEPVFNKFYPLADGPLKQEILSLARANGIPASDVYEFDASKQTKRMSAHVSGLFNTVQISLNDNLMNRAAPEEVKAVLGHEMGHYVLNHVYKGIVFFGLLIVIGFAFLKWSFDKVRTRWGAGWGIRDVGDVAGLPLLVALFAAYNFVTFPINNTITRTMEIEADMFGLNAAREPDGFAQAAIHLSEYRKMQPGPVEEWVFYDHPSGWHRIHSAMVWKAEHVDDPDIAAYDAAHPKIEMPPEPTQK